MNILLTGANGFIGRNLSLRLSERKEINVYKLTRDSNWDQVTSYIDKIDFIVHLAGVNRPKDKSEFITGNVSSTENIIELIKQSGKKIPIIFSSSTQAALDNDYGQSKREAEEKLLAFAESTENPVFIYRLPGVFGKWCKPNYNSVVATFCHNIANDLPITVNDPEAQITLVYVDDVIDSFLTLMFGKSESQSTYTEVTPMYEVTLGELSQLLHDFRESRNTMIVEQVGAGFCRALYSTFITYYQPEQFAYKVPAYSDPRGTFVEMLKTKDSGQISYFTAPAGETRGQHYHHTKTEKFLVVKGEAKFAFQNMLTNDYFEKIVSGETPEIVETIPGWAHNITNIGQDEMIAMLWANEIFDRDRPDTIAHKVETK